MDPALPDRVLSAILERPRVAGRDPVPARTRTLRRALGHVLFAVVLCFGLARGDTLRAVSAGPLDTEKALARARTLGDGPWPAYTRALQDVIRSAGRADPSRQRAIELWARALHRAGRPADACAAWAHAARHARPGDSARERATLALGRLLHAELDDDAAVALLETIPARGARLLAGLYVERRDPDALAALLEEPLDPALRIRLLGQLGELALDAGVPKAAQRALRRAARVIDELGTRDDAEALRAVRAWLRLPLRSRLAE
ncbi:MAG: hypothetical protein QNJ98_01875 [Planctomycetota bacterium]|nr:hypothetical protein [Planctomycetota bacterium]